MAEVITMPRLSDTMTDGKVAKWHKKVGDAVKEGDILAEIETDKAVQDFESEINGTLLYIGTEEGSSSPVDSVLAIIGEEGEDISALKGVSSEPKSDEKDLAKDAGTSEKEAAGIPEEFKTEENVTDVETTKPVEKEGTETASANVSAEIPKGVEVITMPRLSDTMTEGKVAKWHKKVGDTVKEGDILAEIETDKAVQDFESEVNGTLLYTSVNEGEASPVDTILAIIGPEGTDVSAIVSGGSSKSEVRNPKSEETAKTEEKKPEVAESKPNSESRLAISPLAKKMAEEKGIDVQALKGSGENGRIVKKMWKDLRQVQSKSMQKRKYLHLLNLNLNLYLFRVKIQRLQIHK